MTPAIADHGSVISTRSPVGPWMVMVGPDWWVESYWSTRSGMGREAGSATRAGEHRRELRGLSAGERVIRPESTPCCVRMWTRIGSPGHERSRAALVFEAHWLRYGAATKAPPRRFLVSTPPIANRIGAVDPDSHAGRYGELVEV